jgi:hypothetical protein
MTHHKQIADTTTEDGVTPIGFIVGTVSDFLYRNGLKERPKPTAQKIAATIETATQDQRIDRALAHAQHESVRSVFAPKTQSDRLSMRKAALDTAIWSMSLQGVGAKTVEGLKVAHASMSEVAHA